MAKKRKTPAATTAPAQFATATLSRQVGPFAAGQELTSDPGAERKPGRGGPVFVDPRCWSVWEGAGWFAPKATADTASAAEVLPDEASEARAWEDRR